MKKLLIATALATALSGISAFGQGYYLFTSTKNHVYDAFDNPGTSSIATTAGSIDFAFLWSSSASTSAIGAGNPTSNTSPVTNNVWTTILNDPNFKLATSGGSVIVASLVSPGGFTSGGGANVVVDSAPSSGTVNIFVIGWSSAYSTPALAAAANAPVGWSSVFSYSPGASATSPTINFSASGMAAFAVSPVAAVPEPASFALAGLGAAALMIFRRRK